MQDGVTIARPYAKAAFDHALSHQSLDEWSRSLAIFSQTIKDQEAADFIKNPETSSEDKIALMLNVLRSIYPENVQAMSSFLNVLAKQGRLTVLPDIYLLFEASRSAHEKKLTAEVKTFYPFTPQQEKALQDALGKRFEAEVILQITVDKSLLGGAVIKVGDWVVDGSVKNKLNRLGMALERL